MIHLHRQQGTVGLAHPFGGGIGAHRQHLNAGTVAIGGAEQHGAIFGGEAGIPQARIDRGQQAPHHRQQMGRELKLHPMAGHLARQLLDFAGVAMAHHAIGRHGFGRFGQQQILLGGATATGSAGFGINHDAAGFNQSLLEERQQGQQAGGGEAARRRHQPGGGDPLRRLPLHQAVDGLFTESTIRARELAGFGSIHVLPLTQGAVAVVGGEIHHPHTPLQQRGNQLGGEAIGQAQHCQISCCRNRVGIRAMHHQVGGQRQERHQLTPALAAAAFAPQKGDRKLGVSQQQPQRLQTSVTTGTDHGDAFA